MPLPPVPQASKLHIRHERVLVAIPGQGLYGFCVIFRKHRIAVIRRIAPAVLRGIISAILRLFIEPLGDIPVLLFPWQVTDKAQDRMLVLFFPAGDMVRFLQPCNVIDPLLGLPLCPGQANINQLGFGTGLLFLRRRREAGQRIFDLLVAFLKINGFCQTIPIGDDIEKQPHDRSPQKQDHPIGQKLIHFFSHDTLHYTESGSHPTRPREP